MSKFHYEVPVDSPTGERISRFWHRCIKAEQAAEEYAKKMGAKFYYSDPRYFAGGCVCIAFDEGQRIDKSVWRLAGTDRADGLQYWEPDVERRTGLVPIPHRDYALKDTFDRIYDRSKIQEREGKLFVPYVEFFRQEVTGHSGSSGKRSTASRGLRKAIKAEVQRLRLPVVRTEALLDILAADTVGPSTSVSPAPKQPKEPTTPTFFLHRSRYFIGIDYPCTANADLKPIVPEVYKLNQDKAELEAKRGWS